MRGIHFVLLVKVLLRVTKNFVVIYRSFSLILQLTCGSTQSNQIFFFPEGTGNNNGLIIILKKSAHSLLCRITIM